MQGKYRAEAYPGFEAWERRVEAFPGDDAGL